MQWIKHVWHVSYTSWGLLSLWHTLPPIFASSLHKRDDIIICGEQKDKTIESNDSKQKIVSTFTKYELGNTLYKNWNLIMLKLKRRSTFHKIHTSIT